MSSTLTAASLVIISALGGNMQAVYYPSIDECMVAKRQVASGAMSKYHVVGVTLVSDARSNTEIASNAPNITAFFKQEKTDHQKQALMMCVPRDARNDKGE